MSRPGKRRFSDTKEDKPAPRPLMELDSRPSTLLRRPMHPMKQPMPMRQQDIYSGPVEYLPAGTRGFLISTCHGQEEFALDEAMELLRVAAVQLNGGMKAGRKNRVEDGFVPVNFLDMETVKVIPNPDGDDEEDKKEDEDEDTPSEPKAKKEKNDFSDEERDDKKDSKEEEKQNEDKSDAAKDNKEEDMDQSEEKETKDEKNKTESEDGKSVEGKGNRSKSEYIFMRSIFKFKAYRTEVRNCLFIACDHPEPSELAGAAMGLVGRGFPLGGDALVQLIPVIGVADFNLMQLEVMARRVLGPLFDESEPPVSYALMLHDKLSEQPGSQLLCETLRSVVWALDPRASPASPLTEPALTLRLEVLGSKLCLAALPDFVRFRQYSPTLLAVLGQGEAEDDDLTWACQQQRDEYRAFKIRKRKEEKELKALEKKRQEQKKAREAARLKQEKEMEEKRKEREQEKADRKEKEEKRISEQAELARQWAERQAKESNQPDSEATNDQTKETTDAEPAAAAMEAEAAAATETEQPPAERRSPVPLSPPRPEPQIPGLDLVEVAAAQDAGEQSEEAAAMDTTAEAEESQSTEAESQPTEAESQPAEVEQAARPTRKRKARK